MLKIYVFSDSVCPLDSFTLTDWWEQLWPRQWSGEFNFSHNLEDKTHAPRHKQVRVNVKCRPLSTTNFSVILYIRIWLTMSWRVRGSKRNGSHSAGIHVPFTNCFVCRWFCVVHDPNPPVHSHNWLSFGKFQDTERFLIHCERHFSSRLPPSGGIWKYAKAPSAKKNLERFSTYWYAPFCRVCLGCCAVEFGNPGGTYE